MTNVLLVEDSKITKDLLMSYIDRSHEYQIVTSLENAANAELICMDDEVGVKLVLMDICTADDESGLTAAAKIKKHNPDIKVIIMTSMPEYSFIHKAKVAGCDSFWYKEYGETELLDVMDRTMRGESVFPNETPVVSVGCTKSNVLTERELTVLRQLVLGNKYEEIAEILGVSANTVKFHIRNLLAKTGYRSALQLVADVVSKRLIVPWF